MLAAAHGGRIGVHSTIAGPTAGRIRVLVAEDEPQLAQLLERFLVGCDFDVATHTDGRAALDALRAESYDVALLDVVMPGMDGVEVLRRVREELSPPEVILVTGDGTLDAAMDAMNLGAYDFLPKPYRMAELEALVHRAWEKRQLAKQNLLLRARLSRLDADHDIVTQYAPMQAVLSLVERVARGDAAVLVAGEPGTGKELIAHRIHERSHRAGGPLVEVDCAAIPEELVERELFGDESGAPGDASGRTLGLLELASGGTVYMDGIGALDPRVQGKLLRALELGSFYRVGGTQKAFGDVRLVAATHEDLAQRVTEGTFRADLYYRINTISITLPPLRERAVDIPLLAQHVLDRQGGGPRTLSDDAFDVLQRYPWPGNIRELRAVIERAALITTKRVIRAADLPLTAGSAPPAPPAPATPVTPVTPVRASDALVPLAQVEREHIESVLQSVKWHQGRAADILGISPKTLYRKIREYGFRRP